MQQIFRYERYKKEKPRVKESIKVEFNHCCAYCSFKSNRLTLDHVLAESKGGTDFWRNLVPACARCNRSKGSKNLTDWYTAELPFYSEERLQRILNRSGTNTWMFPTRYAKGFAPPM